MMQKGVAQRNATRYESRANRGEAGGYFIERTMPQARVPDWQYRAGAEGVGYFPSGGRGRGFESLLLHILRGGSSDG